MKYFIKKRDWNTDLSKDNKDIMHFINDAIENDAYPLVPRKEKVTEEEIKNIWFPTRDKSISYVAYSPELDRVVGECSLIMDRLPGVNLMSVLVDRNHFGDGIGSELVKAVIDESLEREITVTVHTSVENTPMIRVMEKLGHFPVYIKKDYERYRGKIMASNYDAFEHVIEPKKVK